MKGICLLCQNDDDLQESHIIPRFVFSWLKETSPTPFLRGSRTPNKRVQDGEKRFWLCAKCEQLIGDYERQFRPIAEDGLHQISYGEWLLKFCVSVSWRNLLREREEHPEKIRPQYRQLVEEALKVWSVSARQAASSWQV